MCINAVIINCRCAHALAFSDGAHIIHVIIPQLIASVRKCSVSCCACMYKWFGLLSLSFDASSMHHWCIFRVCNYRCIIRNVRGRHSQSIICILCACACECHELHLAAIVMQRFLLSQIASVPWAPACTPADVCSGPLSGVLRVALDLYVYVRERTQVIIRYSAVR